MNRRTNRHWFAVSADVRATIASLEWVRPVRNWTMDFDVCLGCQVVRHSGDPTRHAPGCAWMEIAQLVGLR